MTDRDKKINPSEDDVDELQDFNSISAYDCTGLIPTAITDEAEIESYEEVYHYLSPQVNVKGEKRKKNRK